MSYKAQVKNCFYIGMLILIGSTAPPVEMAYADEVDTQLTATVLAVCKIIEVEPLNFGELIPDNRHHRSIAAKVTFACTTGTNYTLIANHDQPNLTSRGKRELKNGTVYLQYTLNQIEYSGIGNGFLHPEVIDLQATIHTVAFKDLPALNFVDTVQLSLLP